MSIWKPDAVLTAATVSEVGTVLLLGASKRGFDCETQRSAIDGRYHTQVNRHAPERVWNVAAGTGATPIESWLNAYGRVIPTAGDPWWAVACLQAEVELLRQAIARKREQERVEAKLGSALDDIETLLADSGRTFHWDHP